MNVEELDLTINRFTDDYLRYNDQAMSFFDYSLKDDQVFNKRLQDLHARQYKRKELLSYFQNVYSELENNQMAMKQIEKLKEEQSVVIVGGQQAGLLTGPLYTIYKAMTIVSLAKKQEQELGVAVIPIFWIAGEDHDLDEIRFVYKQHHLNWKKHLYDDGSAQSSASTVRLNHQKMQQWLDDVFATLPETAYTCHLYDKVSYYLQQSDSFVDFFRYLMHWLFADQGLLLMDAHDPFIRQLEKEYFIDLIEQVEGVQEKQQKGACLFNQFGYGKPIETDSLNAHLFFEVDGTRNRLDYKDGQFMIHGTNHTYTKSELLRLVKRQPERFSNNVVTRPVMQEWLLPVLAFIGGPGEIAYWATLKPVFELFDLKVPPVILRYHMTFVPASVKKWLDEMAYDIVPFLKGEMETLRNKWLQEVNPYPISEVVDNVRERFRENHLPIREMASKMDQTIDQLSRKNIELIEGQLTFIEKKMQQFVRQSHDDTLAKFAEAGRWLSPLNKPQERIIHPFVIMNELGEDEFIKWLSTELSFSRNHKLVFL